MTLVRKDGKEIKTIFDAEEARKKIFREVI